MVIQRERPMTVGTGQVGVAACSELALQEN